MNLWQWTYFLPDCDCWVYLDDSGLHIMREGSD